MVTDTIYLINDVIGEGKNVLIEGANAVVLDFDLCEYQYELIATTTCKFIGNESTNTANKYVQCS